MKFGTFCKHFNKICNAVIANPIISFGIFHFGQILRCFLEGGGSKIFWGRGGGGTLGFVFQGWSGNKELSAELIFAPLRGEGLRYLLGLGAKN